MIGILDADFLHLADKETIPENIFLTDFHDAEMMMISCDNSYHAVLSEYARGSSDLSRDKILESIAFLGGLRWLNDSDELELNFNGLGLGNFYNGKETSLDRGKCLTEVMKRSPKKRRKTLSEQEITKKIKNTLDLLNLCNGHDFQKAFALIVSSHSKKGVKHEEIGKAFRLAYRLVDFQGTDLYRNLARWSHHQAVSLFQQTKQ